ncbi:MAG: two-component regulator propeller domain-containing protein [Bacteroidota bacterium]
MAVVPHTWAQGTALNGMKDLYFDHLDKTSGLPSNIIFCAIQDFSGYIWIGTTNGLVRYDGQDMKVFSAVPGDSSSLVDNSIYALHQSKDSLIWIGTGNGISLFDPHIHAFKNYPFDDKREGNFPVRRVNSFFEEKDGTIWIATADGIVGTSRGSPEHFTLTQFNKGTKPEQDDYYMNVISCITADPRDPDKLLLGTNDGLFRFDKKKRVIDALYYGPPAAEKMIREMWADSSGLLWVCGWGVGLGCFDLKSESWKAYSPARVKITILSILPGDAETIWFVSDELGLGLFNKKTKEFSFYKSNPANPRSIFPGNKLGLSWFNDHHDLWVWGYGIDIVNRDYFSFTQVRVPYKFWWISDFFKDEGSGRLFAGAYHCKGLPVFNCNAKSWELLSCDFPLPEVGLSVTGFLKDSHGSLWISTREGLCYYDPKSNRVRMFRTPDGRFLQLPESPVVYGLLEDDHGNLWVGTRYDGVIRVDAGRKKADYFKNNPSDPHSLINGTHFTTIEKDRFGRIWFGCRMGISIFDPSKNRFDNSLLDTLHKYGMNKRWVNGIARDSLGRIWLAFDYGGLVRVEPRRNGSFGIRLFHPGNGMNDPSTGWITRDPKQMLWVPNNGLLNVDPYQERFRIIDNQNGLHEFPDNAAKIYVDPSGNIYIGDSTGFETRNIKDISNIGEKSFNLVFESMEINGKINPVNISASLNFTADQNNFTFHFAAICFHPPGHIRYRYRLAGYENDWVQAESAKEARYTNLPPGEYEFYISASDGQAWHDGKDSIRFTIHPFFWRTWWFILLSFLLLFLLTFGYYRNRLNHALKLERMRTRIATDLHDDVSSTLSSISILSEILSIQVKDPKPAEMLAEIGANSRSMMERIDDIIWTVNPKNDKFQDLELRIREFAIPLFEASGISFSFDYPEKLATLQIPMEVRRNIYLIAKEAINNLVKYAGCTRADILFREDHPGIVLEIRDNGKGFDPSGKTSRNGLRNMQERAVKIKALLQIVSAPGKGTLIRLTKDIF